MSEIAESLPARFPIFPLSGALLLPGGNLPLNIFEPRYLQMVRDAMRTEQVIGMIQPREAEAGDVPPALFRTGCVGRVASCSETEDGRLEIMLSGLCRFDVARELEVDTPYRQVVGDFSRWRQDRQPEPPPAELKAPLLQALRLYFERQEIEADWEAIEEAPLAGLVTSLAMVCPFEPNEKQALIEAPDLARQTRLLTALMRMDALAEGSPSALRH
jgi:Lon protease-like protein